MPKAELHVHLEGSIHPSTLFKLAQRNGIDLPAKDIKGLREFYKFRNFQHFVKVYVTITGCLRTADDYRLIAYEFGEQCASQNIRYAEVTFTIETNMRITGIPWEIILESLNAGREQASIDFGVTWNWIFDISRDNPDTQETVVDIALSARDRGVVTLGLGGTEADFPGELFISSFERAFREGLPRVPHAGETDGPDSIWTAITKLNANRIGHGVRCIEDQILVTELYDRHIPLEICPTSNIRLGVYENYSQHPLHQLWERNLCITINSDDPPMFSTNLNNEYTLLIDKFNFNIEDLEKASLNGIRFSFLHEDEKHQLEKEFLTAFSHLRKS
jgi:adenosine deaminase